MIVKALEKEWDVKDCTRQERRDLHFLNYEVWVSGKQDVKAYKALLNEIEMISGLKDDDFDGISMTDTDVLLQAIFLDYQKVSKKKAGD